MDWQFSRVTIFLILKGRHRTSFLHSLQLYVIVKLSNCLIDYTNESQIHFYVLLCFSDYNLNMITSSYFYETYESMCFIFFTQVNHTSSAEWHVLLCLRQKLFVKHIGSNNFKSQILNFKMTAASVHPQLWNLKFTIWNHCCPGKIKRANYLTRFFGSFGLPQQKLPWAKMLNFPDSRYFLS